MWYKTENNSSFNKIKFYFSYVKSKGSYSGHLICRDPGLLYHLILPHVKSVCWSFNHHIQILANRKEERAKRDAVSLFSASGTHSCSRGPGTSASNRKLQRYGEELYSLTSILPTPSSPSPPEKWRNLSSGDPSLAPLTMSTHP